MNYVSTSSKNKEDQTANPSKYPQGYFKNKYCRYCDAVFSPMAPSEHYCSNKCKDNGATSAYLMRIYGITYRDYTDLLKGQDYKCKICLGEGFTMAVHLKTKLVVDHCHETGRIRGLLCHNCNRGLGLFKDDKDSLKRSILYLESD